MYKVMTIALFMISCTKQSPAPQKWNDWVQSRKTSFQKKISTPSAVQFLYLPEVAPLFYLNNKSGKFKLSNSRLGSDDIAYKVNFQDESLLDQSGQTLSSKDIPYQVNEHIFIKTVFMPEEKKVRVFLYDLNKKDLAKKRKRHFFSYSKSGVLGARYQSLAQIRTARFQRSDGTTRDFNVMGKLKLENGNLFSVYAEPGQKEKTVMLMFRDQTNGKNTYGAGRYLYVDLPAAPKDLKNGDLVELDFNFSFNPPCAVSKGYHCPLPQDFANFKIQFGEKYL